MSGLDAVKGVTSAAVEIVNLAKDNPDAQKAGQSMARSVKVIANTVETALLPLAIFNAGVGWIKDYFEKKFQPEMEAKLADIPEEHLIAPKPSLAGPAIQGIGFTVDEPDLREMFLSLLATAMDDRKAKSAHPAFVEVIKQMTSEEAALLKHYLSTKKGKTAVAQLRLKTEGAKGYQELEWRVVPFSDAVDIGTILQNWERLGLIEIRFDIFLQSEQHYDFVKESPFYKSVEKAVIQQENVSVDYGKGLISTTPFGQAFAAATGLSTSR